MRTLLVSLVLLALPAAALPADAPTSPPADAAEVKRARELFDSAERLYRQKKYAAAVVKFEEVYAARPLPAVVYNIARCREQLGDTPAALRWYREYLRVSQGEKDQDQVLQSVVELEKKLRAQGVQQLSILCDPPGARVDINGREVGHSPVTTELPEGEHQVTVSAPGYVTAQQRYTHSLLRAADLKVALARVPEQPLAPAPLVVEVPAPAAAVEVAAVPEPAPARGGRFKWVAGGLAVAAGATGVGFGLSARASGNSLVQATSPRPQAEAQALYDRAQTHARLSNVAYGTAVVAAVAATVLFLLDR